MFRRGKITDNTDGLSIDITIKNNPGHFLSPSDWSMVMGVKLGKIPPEEFKTWYHNLLRERWSDRKKEFIELARKGEKNDIVLKCFCHKRCTYCHAEIASKFMNKLTEFLR